MSRVQLALNVDDLDAAITFYSKLFGSRPAKAQPAISVGQHSHRAATSLTE